MAGEYNDAHMLSKSLERIAAQALHLKDKIDNGLEIPSWAEYKVYMAYSGINKALGTAYPGMYSDDMMHHGHRKMSSAAITPAHDNHPALKGKQNRLPDKVQMAIIKKKMQKKAEASVEQQLVAALRAEGGAAGLGALRKRVPSKDMLSGLRSLIKKGKVFKHRNGDLILR
jgi:hypothetical protein